MEKIGRIRWGEIEARIAGDVREVEGKCRLLRQEVGYL